MISNLRILIILVLPQLLGAQNLPSGVPPELGPLKLVESLQGKEAQIVVNRLHEKEVAPKASLMGQYSSGASQATLYVSFYETQAMAASASKRMTVRIKSGNQVFRHYEETKSRGLKLGRCIGLGQVHFFFLFRERMYWLAVDPSAATESLDALSLFVVGKPAK